MGVLQFDPFLIVTTHSYHQIPQVKEQVPHWEDFYFRCQPQVGSLVYPYFCLADYKFVTFHNSLSFHNCWSQNWGKHYTYSYTFIMRDTNEQPDEEINWTRSVRVPSTGACGPVESGCTIFLVYGYIRQPECSKATVSRVFICFIT